MIIVKLTRSVHMPDRWYAELSSGESLKIGTETVAELSLYPGRELSDEELAALRAAERAFSAKERALRLLEARQMSRRELKKKLLEKGEEESAAEAAADLMERIGAVNDREYAGSIVRHYSKKGYGKFRIRQELLHRGIDRELWDEALSEMPEETEAIDTLIENRLRGTEPDRRELKRLTDMLLRRGYTWEEIRAALGRRGTDPEDN